MPQPDAGVTFREVMSGPFALGASDPLDGARAGLRAGSGMSLHARLTISDVQTFAGDAHHRGVLAGEIAFTPMASRLTVHDGMFQLFARSGGNQKLMVYRATFAHDGATYCFNGVKHVGAGSIVRSWSETTTLYTTLHAGADPSARVVGAGVLRLTPAAFVKQLVSFAPVNGGRLSQKALGFSRFFRFFAAELIDSYVAARLPGGKRRR